jgi:23S rRNA A1618 N6-methylase RlmF
MCNPPFYTSEDAMQRSEAQKAVAPRAILTASNNELISAGGEVAFVSRMIQESLHLRKRCRWFTSMLGHLSSLTPLVEMLRSNGIDNYAIGELVQGRTRRWVIGWSFSNVRLPDVGLYHAHALLHD